MDEVGRRRFLGGMVLLGASPWLASCVSFTPTPTMGLARHTLMGLWDAIVPGTFNGVVEDASPGATEAGVQEWLEGAIGTLPAPLDFLSDWFLRAWADDLDLWANVFHFPIDDGLPHFGDLPLGPTLAESGRQYKVMLMMGLFDGVIELQYFAAMSLAKLAVYCDFRAETAGTPRVGGPMIGFPGAVGSGRNPNFTYARPAGSPDARLTRTAGGLVAVP
ncbi:MAG: hypothetical protein U0Q22_14220 [Acidimicrobiales bacterium]